MKRFAFIFSLYICALAVMPCTDALACNDSHHTESQSVTDLAHADHDEADDSCSPFCACSCCGCAGAVLIRLSYNLYEQPRVPSAPNNVFYMSTDLSTFSAFIWQPPKLSYL